MMQEGSAVHPSPPRRRTGFFSDLIRLVMGTTSAQLVSIAVAPILTRLYGPEAFGLLALFMAITGLLGMIACLRYEFSIVLPHSDAEGANLLGLSLALSAFFSLLTVPVFWIGGRAILELLNATELETYLWLVSLTVLVLGVFSALNYWNSRTKQFGRLSAARVTSSVTMSGAQVGAGFAGFTSGGSLIGANFLGHLVSTLILGVQIWRDDRRLFRESVRWQSMIGGFRRYRRFPLFDTVSAVLNALAWQLPVFFLAAFFSPAIVGFYSLGFRILQLPMFFVGGALAQVFFQRAAEAKLEGRLGALTEGAFRMLVGAGIFPILAVTVIGADLFALVFGEVWMEAGVYAQILSIWAFVWFISSPLSTLYLVLERQDFGLKVNALNLGTRVAALYVGGLAGDPRIALGLFAVSGIFSYGYLCLNVLDFSGVPLVAVRQFLLQRLALVVPAIAALGVLKILGAGRLTLLLAAVALGLFYYLHLIRTDVQARRLLDQLGISRPLSALRDRWI